MQSATAEVKVALNHVKEHHPEVVQVFFGINGNWLFFDEDLESPSFGPEIDIDLIHAAVDSINTLPASFLVQDDVATIPSATDIGWRKVPVLPTPDQLRAVQQAGYCQEPETAKSIYMTMVKSAPSQNNNK